MIFVFSFWSGIFGLFFNHKVAQSTFLSLLSSFRSGSSSPRRDSGGLLLPITAFFLTISWFSNKARFPCTKNYSFMRFCWVGQHPKAYLANVVRWGGPKTIANPEEEIIKMNKKEQNLISYIFWYISFSAIKRLDKIFSAILTLVNCEREATFCSPPFHWKLFAARCWVVITISSSLFSELTFGQTNKQAKELMNQRP